MENDDDENLMNTLDKIEAKAASEQPETPGAAAGVLSPTIAALEERHRPNPMPVCGPCPNSMWFASGKALKCYCRLMHVVTFESENPQPITACDGILQGL